MSFIYGVISNSETDPAHLQILRDDLTRFPSDSEENFQDGLLKGGQFAYRLRKPPFPEERFQRDPESGISVVASARLDYRHELLSKLGISTSQEAQISDSELILRAYLHWGKKCVDHLEGDFSFLVWNPSSEEIWGARDPIGFKPLFYTEHRGAMYFSSHTTGLARLPFTSDEPDEDFWRTRLLNVRRNQFSTPFRGIYQLPIGHEMTIKEGQVEFKKFFFWKTVPIREKVQRSDYAEQLRELMRAAVKTRLYSDYTVGAYLSGGLDSSAVVAFAQEELKARNVSTRMVTTTSVYPDERNSRFDDERPWAELFKQYYPSVELNHFSFSGKPEYRPQDAEMFASLNFRRYSARFVEMPMQQKMLAEGCRTFLTGWRGDNFISRGHYAAYVELFKRGKWAKFASAIWRNARFLEQHPISLLRTVQRYTTPKKRLRQELHLGSELLNSEWVDRVRSESTRHFRNEHRWELTDMNKDMHRFLPDHVVSNFYFDDHSFSHSEVFLRLNPFTDPRLINFALQIPAEEYVKEGMDRSIMRRALAGVLPDQLRLRITKGSFLINEAEVSIAMLDSWLSRNDLHSVIESSKLQKLLKPQKIGDYLQKFRNEIGSEGFRFTRKSTFFLNLLGYLFYLQAITNNTMIK